MDEAWVARSASVLRLELGEQGVKDVAQHLQRIAQVAAGLDEIELDPFSDELAPVWRP